MVFTWYDKQQPQKKWMTRAVQEQSRSERLNDMDNAKHHHHQVQVEEGEGGGQFGLFIVRKNNEKPTNVE